MPQPMPKKSRGSIKKRKKGPKKVDRKALGISEALDAPIDWFPVIAWPNFFYSQQAGFIKSNAYQTWFIGGNGSGKTHVIYWSVAAYATGTHPNQPKDRLGNIYMPLRICVLVPDFDNVFDVALEKLLDPQIIEPFGIDIGPMLPHSLIKRDFSKDHRSIDLTNGTIISFRTNEQGWKAMRGRQFDILSIDEEPEHRVFDENHRGLRNAKGGGKIIAGLTPPFEEGQGPTWTKEMVVDASLTDNSIDVFNACMYDNPAITNKFIEEFKKGKTQRQIDVQVYGKHPTWGDLVYPGFQDHYWNPENITGHLFTNEHPMPENNAVDWVMAFDWHPSKPCAAIFGFLDGSGNVVIYDELNQETARGKDIRGLAENFRSLEGEPYEQRHFRRWQDPSAKAPYNAQVAGFNAWDAFRENGIVTSVGKNIDQKVGISTVNDFFRGNAKDHPRVFIYERCKYLRRYLANNYWKRAEDGVGKPDPKWSDYPVCLRYIIEGVRGPKSRKRVKWPLQSFKRHQEKRNIINLKI